MDRRLNRALLDKWISEHGPDGVSRLAIQSQVSSETIKRVRASEVAPKKLITCKRLSEAVGATVDELFPLPKKAGGRAS